ncbi:hypothetical protein JXJ21_01015 [candidate division KSB1 bacterium]|nr:hypothetical protein [candidate division KSB1 bacterium]
MEINTSILFKWDNNIAQWIPVRQAGWLQKLADIFEEESSLRSGAIETDIKVESRKMAFHFRNINWIFLRANS